MSDDDKKTRCKYGASCYQKNSTHLKKYSHPKPERSSEPPSKKHKRDSASPKQLKDASPTPKKPDEASDDSDSFSEKQKRDYDSSKKQMGGEDSSSKKRISGDISPKQEKNEEKAESVTKQEEISSSDEDDTATKTENVTKEFKKLKTHDERKRFIKQKFLVDMPEDFYQFWDLCKKLSADKPKESFKQAGLTLVGPYDVLDESFEDKNYSDNDYLLHWRYYYDPPEFQTIIRGDDKKGFHMGYFRDSPEEKPVFVASNSANISCTINPMGGNIFAALNSYIENLLKTADPFKKMSLSKLYKSVINTAKDLSINLNKSEIDTKHRRTVCKTFHSAGIVVPFNRKTELGYRKLPVDEKELKSICKSVCLSYEADSEKAFSRLQPIITAATIANDECDFGTALEFGINLFCYGNDVLNQTALNVLTVAYALLGRHGFAKIAEVHFKNRKQGLPFVLQ